MEDMNMLTDEQLVCLYAEGENTAFDVLLQRHQNRIFSYIYNIVKDKDLADDLFRSIRGVTPRTGNSLRGSHASPTT